MEGEEAVPHVYPAKRIAGVEDNIWSHSCPMVIPKDLG